MSLLSLAQFRGTASIKSLKNSKYPPAKPGALGSEPLKAAVDPLHPLPVPFAPPIWKLHRDNGGPIRDTDPARSAKPWSRAARQIVTDTQQHPATFIQQTLEALPRKLLTTMVGPTFHSLEGPSGFMSITRRFQKRSATRFIVRSIYGLAVEGQVGALISDWIVAAVLSVTSCSPPSRVAWQPRNQPDWHGDGHP
jgi:hypothetical protein